MTTTQENLVTIRTLAVSKVEYAGMLHVTSGQPYSGDPEVHKTDGGYVIQFLCGRSTSSAVANAFNTAAGGAYHEFPAPYLSGRPYAAMQPSELNFCFAMNLTFGEVGPVTVWFGQGHSYTIRNNWWLGGAAILNSSPAYSLSAFLMATPQTLFRIYTPKGDDVNIFVIDPFS
jgi:hypothetical protein